MASFYAALRAKVDRDSKLGLLAIVRKGLRYGSELATAPWYLLDADEVGRGVRTLHRPRIDNQGHLRIGRGTLLRSVIVPVELGIGPGATLEIGEDCSLNYGVSVGAMGSVRLGNRVRLGPYAMVIDSDFHDLYDRKTRPPPRPVVLEDDVWIGAKATVLPGVTIGRGSVVGVGSVVNTDVPPFTVVAGVPAKPIKTLDPARFVVR
jgi:maltose O-acetyltransferase